RMPQLGRSIRPISDLRALAAIATIFFRESPDVVHTHTAKAGVLGRLAALLFNATRSRRNRCLVVHTYHGHVLEGYYSAAVHRAIQLTERALGRATDWIVAISPSQQRDLVNRYRIAPSEKTRIIALGLELESLRQISSAPRPSAELRDPPDNLVIGYIG